MSINGTNAHKDQFIDYLGKKGLRVTGQRLAILEAALAHTGTFTAEALLVRARSIDDSISRATIYRTFPLLIACEILREVDVGKDFKYYTLREPKHIFQAQVICSDCDRIFEMDAPFMEWYGNSIAEKLNLEAQSQRLQVTARCPGTCTNGKGMHTAS